MKNTYFKKKINGSPYGDTIEECVDRTVINQYLVLLNVAIDGSYYCVMSRIGTDDENSLGNGINIWSENVTSKLYAFRYVNYGEEIHFFGIDKDLAEKLVQRAIQKSSDRYTDRNKPDAEDEQHQKNVASKRKIASFIAAALTFIIAVLIIGAIDTNHQKKEEERKQIIAEQERERKQEAIEREKAAFEESIEDTILWNNLKMNNDARLGKGKNSSEELEMYDYYYDIVSDVKLSGLYSKQYYRDYDVGKIKQDFLGEDTGDVEYSKLNGTDYDLIKSESGESDNKLLSYVVASPYSVYKLTVSVKDPEKLDDARSMMNSLSIDAEKQHAEDAYYYDSLAEMPYYMMLETEVEQTKWGKADSREEEEMDKTKFYPTITYRWYDEDKGVSLYVRCHRIPVKHLSKTYTQEFYVMESTLHDKSFYNNLPVTIYVKDINNFDSPEEILDYLYKEDEYNYFDEDDVKLYWKYMKEVWNR